MIRKILLGLLAILLVIQFFRPAKNNSNDQQYHIKTLYPMSADLTKLMEVACDDCHSNNTRYPWYSNFQPLAWWLDDHIKEGTRHLNFSNLASRRIALQNKKLEEVVEMIEEGEMPLYSYTLTHSDARLTADQKKMITDWAKSASDHIKATYPADSLVLPNRPAPAK